MPLPFNFTTTFIPGTACIGDTRPTINNNFSTLLSAVSTLWFGSTQLSSNGVSVLTYPTVIEANSQFPALRVTQTGSGNVVKFEDDTNPDVTPFVITSAGQIVIGSVSAFNPNVGIQIVANQITGPNSDILLRTNTDFEQGSQILFEKARGTQSVMSAISTNDLFGSIVFNGYNGVQMVSSAIIAARVDGVVSLSSVPSCLTFSTSICSVSAFEVQERMRITNNGLVGINTKTPTTTLDVSGSIRATGGVTVSGLNIVPAGNLFPFRTISNIVSALAINVDNKTLYLPLLSAL